MPFPYTLSRQKKMMINNKISKEIIENFNPFIGLEESLEYANTRISNLENKNSILESENSKIPELEAEKSALEDKNSIIEAEKSALETENSSLKLEIEKLKNKLNTN